MIQARRFGLGTLINYLGVNTARSIRVVIPKNKKIQRAIGNKVRKAKRLKELACYENSVLEKIVCSETNLFSSNSDSLYSWTTPCLLSNRFDPKYYSIDLNRTRTRLKKQNCYPLSYYVDEISVGSTPKKFSEDKKIAFINSGCISTDLIKPDNLLYIDSAFHEKNLKSSLSSGDLLVAKDGNTIGHLAVVPKWLSLGNINEHCYRLRLKNKKYSIWLRYFLTSFVGNTQLLAEATGSAQAGLNSDFIDNVFVYLPGDEIIDKFYRIGFEIFEKLFESEKQIFIAKTAIESLIKGTIDQDFLLSEGEEIEKWLTENPSPYVNKT